MGRVYRETTPAMLARVATLDERIALAREVAANLLREAEDSGVRTGIGLLPCGGAEGI
jgi:hypothetical protein